MIDHARRLLSRAALAEDGRIAVTRGPSQSWPGDHSRLCALENDGHLTFLGEQAGGTRAAWRITENGLAALHAPDGVEVRD